VFFAATVLNALAGLAAVMIYTAIFPPDLYGKYELVNTTYLVFYAFLCGWISSSFFRYYLEYKTENKQEQLFGSIFSMLLIINALLLVIFFIAYKFFIRQEIMMMVLIFAFNLLPRCLIDLFTTKFKLDDSMKGYFFITVANSIGNLAISVFLITVSKIGIAALVISPTIVSGLILLLLIVRHRTFFRFRFDKGIMADFWEYGGPLIITGLINISLSISDRYIIRYFFSDREVGIYGFSYSMSERFFRIFVNVFALTIQTYLMQVWHRNKENYNSAVKTFTRYYYILFIPLIFIVQTILDFMFHNIFNKSYLEGQSLTLVVLLAMFVEGLINIANRGFTVNKRTDYLRNVSFVAILLNLLLNFLLVPVFGYATAAYTTLGAYMVYLWLIYVYSVRKINWKWEFYDKSLLTSGAYWTASYLVIRFSPGYIAKFAVLAVACILYLLVLPGDIKQLIRTYSRAFLDKLKGV
jgi:O-antigen/teichoic acid export membrane protein